MNDYICPTQNTYFAKKEDMKNGNLIWNSILTILVGVLLFFQLKPSSKKNNVIAPKSDSSSTGFKIAYFEMDSVEANYDMVKDVKGEIVAKNNELTKNIADLDSKYKAKYEALAAKNYTSQDEHDKAQDELQQYASSLKGQKDDYEQKYQDFVMRKNLAVKGRIEDFLKQYNSNREYAYIISYEVGLFYYRDTAYNITRDLIKGLNEDYKNKKGKQEQK